MKWKKKGGSWKAATVKADSKKFTKLAKSAKCQFKVRAYCKNGYDIVSDTATSWSVWPNVKTVKTKKK